MNSSLCGVDGVHVAVGGGDFREAVLEDFLAEGGGDG